MDHKVILDEAQEFGFAVDPTASSEDAPFNQITRIDIDDEPYLDKVDRLIQEGRAERERQSMNRFVDPKYNPAQGNRAERRERARQSRLFAKRISK